MSRSDGANWSAQTYVQSRGPDLYRRTMYTFWKPHQPAAVAGDVRRRTARSAPSAGPHEHAAAGRWC